MPPNVIFFLTDQQRWDSMGLHGNPLDLTPNLDRVARENLHLVNCFTPQPLCVPARSCLQTGLYATGTGCTRNGRRLPAGIPTLAHYFKEGGYDTGYIGKWHLAGADNPQGPVPVDRRGGYQYWLAAETLELISEPYSCVVYDGDERKVSLPGYRVDALTDAAIRYIDDHKSRPFFLFLSLLEPHQQNNVDDFPPPVGYRECYHNRWTPPDLQALEGSTGQHLGGYWGMVRRIDEAYGRLQDALRSLGLLENTIVLFTSDHGCHFKTRNDEYKRSCHEASIRVPGVISGPGFRGSGQLTNLISLLDFLPTVLDAAGLNIPEGVHGRSLLPLLRQEPAGEPIEWPSEIFVQITDSGIGRAIRTARWKYAVASLPEARNGDQSICYEERFLYDLDHDPYEIENLIGSGEHESVRAHLCELLKGKMREAGESEAAIVPLANPR